MSRTTEQQSPWCGLAYVLEHGLPGYPAPAIANPPMVEEPASSLAPEFSFSCIGADAKGSHANEQLRARLNRTRGAA